MKLVRLLALLALLPAGLFAQTGVVVDPATYPATTGSGAIFVGKIMPIPLSLTDGKVMTSSSGGGGGGTSSTFGAAFPTTGTAAGFKDSTGALMTFGKVDASNHQLVAQGTAASVVASGWPFINGELSDVTGTFTNATQTTSITTNVSTDGYNVATVSINGTYGTATAVFEASDDGGVTYYSVQGVRTESAVVETGYTGLTNVSRQWTVSIQGNGNFRVRSTAVASGTANVRITISSAVSAAAATQVYQPDLTLNGQSAQTATINNILADTTASTVATDASGYRSASVQVVSTGSGGTYIFEGSNDNTNFQTIPVYSQLIVTGTPIVAAITATSSQLIYTFPIVPRYIRLRIATTITGGSIQAFTVLKQTSWSPPVTQVTQATAANLNVTATVASISTSVTPGTAAANLGKAEDAASASADTGVAMWGVRRTTPVAPQTSASGDYSEIAVNAQGAVTTAPFGQVQRTFRAVANVAAAVTATDIAILPGNATTTVYVTNVTISGIQTTAGLVDTLLVKRSVANSGGTSAAITAVPLDATDTAAVSLPLSYTANPTPGAAVGTIDRAYVNAGPLATAVTPVTYSFDFGRYGKPVVLSGTAQGLAVNLNGVTVTGGTFTIVYEWIEVL